MKRRDFDKYWPKYKGIIAAIARKYGLRDDALVEDLEQEGAMALLSIDPKKSQTNLDAMIRNAIRNRMIDFLRKYNPKVYVSLDDLIESGHQLESDDAGDVRLLAIDAHERAQLDFDPEE